MFVKTKQTNKSNILVQGSILAAASIMVRIIGLIYRIPMTRILGDTAMGYYGSAYEFYSIALLLSSYSLPLAVSKLVSTRVEMGMHKNAKRVFVMALAFGIVVGSIATCVCFFGAPYYADYIGQQGVIAPLRVLAPTIFVFSVMGVIRGYFQGHGNMVPTAISQVIEQIVNAVVSVGAAYWMYTRYSSASYGAAGGTLGTFAGAVAALLSLVTMYMIYRRAFAKIASLESEDSRDSERPAHILWLIVVTVVPVVVSQTVYQVSGTLDDILFNRIMGNRSMIDTTRAAMMGIYTNKYRLLTNVPVAVASALGTAIVPGLIADYLRGRLDTVKDKVASAVKFNMIIAFPSAIGMSALAGPILMLLLGDSNPLSRNVLMFGSISILFFALSTLTNGILQGINHLHIPVIHSAISLVIHLGTLYILLTYTDLGIYALVICNVLFAAVVCVLNWIAIGRYLSYRQEILKTFAIPLIASVVMGACARCCYLVLDQMVGNGIACVASIGVAVVVYFALLILLQGVTKEELLAMPKGRFLVRILTKIRLLR